ncbi:hypothetical protein HDU93_001363 [Gonapodya sp. JEL0774]|nr:hypothetical protein HDU93_001363 [Gonapodya sp. JEL0774]
MGIKAYAISPFRQKPFAGVFSKSIYNVYRRTVAQLPYVGPAILVFCGVYSWGCKVPQDDLYALLEGINEDSNPSESASASARSDSVFHPQPAPAHQHPDPVSASTTAPKLTPNPTLTTALTKRDVATLLMDSSVTDTRIKGVKLVQTTDFFYPNVDDPYWQGRISAANVLSDLYAMGVPEVDNVLMLLGICRDPRMLRSDRDAAARLMMEGFRDTCAQAGTSVRGGQTVMSPWFIIGGVATTVESSSSIIYPTNAFPGDVLVLTKPLGTQVASNVHVWLKGRDQKPERWDRLAGVITEEEAVAAYVTQILTMARLNRTGAKLARKYGAHACTDVTGFGLLGHAKNLASNQTRPVEFVIHTLPIIKKMAAVNTVVNYNLTEGRSAETSGGLLLAIPRDRARSFIEEITRLDGWPAWIVGDVVDASSSPSTSSQSSPPSSFPLHSPGARSARIIHDAKIVEVEYRGYDQWNEDGSSEVEGWEEGWELYKAERDE